MGRSHNLSGLHFSLCKLSWARLNSQAPNSNTLYGLNFPTREEAISNSVSMTAFDNCPQFLYDGPLSIPIMGPEEEQSETSLAGICA